MSEKVITENELKEEKKIKDWKTEFGCPLCSSLIRSRTEYNQKGEIENSYDYCYCVDENGESTGEAYIFNYVKNGEVIEDE